VHYLGPDLPAAEIGRFARETAAAVVAISVVLHEQLDAVPAQLEELAAGLPPATAIWLGGAAARALSHGTLPECCVVLQDGAELEQRLEMLPA
jgi:cobalamin-dependent methionine synthase I